MSSRSAVAIVGGIAAVTLGVIWGLPDAWEVGDGPDNNNWHTPTGWEVGAAPDDTPWNGPDAWEIGTISDNQGSEWTAVSRPAPNDWR